MKPLALLWLALAAAGPWEDDGVVDGIALSTRTVDGFDAPEIRVSARFPAPPAEVFAALLDVPSMTRNRPHCVEARSLERKGDVLRYYQRIEPPIVSERDYVIEARLSATASGGYRMSFQAVNDARAPERPGVVRLTEIRGSWMVEPAADGKASQVTYQLISDARASVPAFAANRAARSASREVLRKLREAVARPEYRGARPEVSPPPGAAPTPNAAPAPGTVAPTTEVAAPAPAP